MPPETLFYMILMASTKVLYAGMQTLHQYYNNQLFEHALFPDWRERIFNDCLVRPSAPRALA